jgi:hypothetical protein
MGLLDDAIREHLELKRRRGADPDEVARQEHEALGPPRMDQFAEPTDEFEDAEEPGRPVGEAPPSEEAPAAVAAGEEPWLEEHEPPADEEATSEFAAADVEEPPPAGEDVLEETPDFLQETPDHDRLWFEQRPPRDFDFDK